MYITIYDINNNGSINKTSGIIRNYNVNYEH